MKRYPILQTAAVFTSCVLLLNSYSFAQPLVAMETVAVADTNNAADANGLGSVAYAYRIGKFEVTISQYTTFLNAVAKSDPYALWITNMASDTNIAGIVRNGLPGSYSYTVIGPFGETPTGAASPGNRPITYVNWYDAARFCNWLHNGATDAASTETGAYTLNGQTDGPAPARNSDATWWIPTENEWYKAAYYKGGGANAGYWIYPTQSDSPPGNVLGEGTNQANWGLFTDSQNYSAAQNYLTDAGAYSLSPGRYGTFDQGGNVWELNDLNGSSGEWRSIRGGAWGADASFMVSSHSWLVGPWNDGSTTGFRVAKAISTNAILALEKND
jgi:formylglycine-generating enzyme required for sulfatase activity